MMAALGVAVGFVLGARAGQKRLDEIIDAIEYVANSEEFKDMIALSGTILAGFLRQGVPAVQTPETRAKIAGIALKAEKWFEAKRLEFGQDQSTDTPSP